MNSALNRNTGVRQRLPSGLPKPEEKVNRIIKCLLPASSPVIMQKAGGNLTFHQPDNIKPPLFVLLLLKGQINFVRNSSGGIIFGTAKAPSVLGLTGSSFRQEIFSYIALAGSQVYILPRETAIDLINEQKLIREVLDYHAYIADMEVIYSNRLINTSSYEIVQTLLFELAELPVSVRRKTSVAQFILERSNIGRSNMMRILADLRKGEYIDIQNGKLNHILKKLPKAY